jgi:protein O-mannosyl-transferase
MKAKSAPVQTYQTSLFNSVWFQILLLLALIAAVYASVPGFGLTNWDDEGYVLNNALLKLPFPALQVHFSTFLMGNYHPLTTLSLHLDTLIWKDPEKGMHLTNVLLHGLNTLLLLGWLRTMPALKSWALPAALLFAIHPMHVESVAWVSERKDVLYTLFYFSTLWIHTAWQQEKISFASAAPLIFLLFALSALAKGMAVTLPLALMLSHYLYGNRKDLKHIVFYGILILGALAVGFIAIQAQQSTDSIKTLSEHALFERPLYALFALSAYIGKWLMPLSLSNFYPYPDLSAPLTWLMIVATPVLIVGLWRMRKWNPEMTWGILFFVLHLLPVLQLLPVGEAIIADRYTYIAAIGLCIAVCALAKQIIPNHTVRVVALCIWLVGLTYAARQRTNVWRDSLTLWNDMIRQYPDGYFVAYNNRAIALQKAGKTREALDDYTRAISMFAPYRDAWYNRGSLYADLQQHPQAISDLSQAIQLDTKFKLAYYNRANSYAATGQMDAAMADYLKTLEIDPNYAEAWTNLGNVYGVKGMHSDAEFAFSKSIYYQPENAYAYNNRALARASQGKMSEAEADFKSAIGIHQAAGNIKGMEEASANMRIYFP